MTDYGTEGTKAANETLSERLARWRREDPAWWATYDETRATTRHCPDPTAHVAAPEAQQRQAADRATYLRGVADGRAEAANRPATDARVGGEHCQDCGGPVGLVWHADDDLWARATQDGAAILCSRCFDHRADPALGKAYLVWVPTVTSGGGDWPTILAAHAVQVGVQAAGFYPARALSNTANTSQMDTALWDRVLPEAVAGLAAKEMARPCHAERDGGDE